MGTFSSARNEYQDPAVPAEFAGGRNLRNAFMRGWVRGIWHGQAGGAAYSRPNMQRSFEAGNAAAVAARRERGEQIP